PMFHSITASSVFALLSVSISTAAQTEASGDGLSQTAQGVSEDDTIIVQGTRGSFPLGVGKSTTLGVLGDRDLIDTPLSVKRFEEQFIRDVQAVRIADFATRDASFAVQSSPADSVLSNALLRGFRIGFTEYSWNGYFPLISRNPPLEIVESIDILKGPTSLLTGARPFSPTAGTINLRTKAPTAEPLTQVTGRFLGDGIFGGDVDFSRRLESDDRFGFRTNIAYREGDPLKDNQREEAFTGHVAFSYEGDRLEVNAEALYSDYVLEGRNDGALFYQPGVDILKPIPDYERLAAPDWTYIELETKTTQVRAKYDLTESVELFGAINVGNFFLSPKALQVFVADNEGNADVGGFFFAFDADQVAGDIGLRWRIENEIFTNQLTLTGSFFSYDSGSSNFQRGIDLTNGAQINVYDYDALISVPNFDSGFDNADTIPKTQFREAVSYGVINETSFFDGKLDVIWGGRFTDFTRENASGEAVFEGDDFSPSVGVVFKPATSFSIYASYMEALEFGAQAPMEAINFGEFTSPGRSESIEIGAKADFGTFGITTAIFDITKPAAFLDPDTLIFDLFGEDRHRGFEADIFGEIREGIRIYGSLAYLDAEIVENVNPALEGNRPINVPELSLAAGFDVDVAFIPNLAVTGAARYTGDRFFDATNERSIDEAAVVDLGLRYGFVAGETDMVARLNVTNIFDESYYAGAFFITAPGESRNVLASLTANF
ncbi:MAG: TonB-dependent siderophore receptor, partial [Pseudomonadota bacterium]